MGVFSKIWILAPTFSNMSESTTNDQIQQEALSIIDDESKV
jgi:hypothetical protein